MSYDFCEMSCEILQATDDGEQLAPVDLKVIEVAVNGYLSEAGEVYFIGLYKRVTKETYKKPWLHGVEHVTKDHQGYVYWKDKEVEHYSFRDSEAEAKATQWLAEACLLLESQGREITIGNYFKACDELRENQKVEEHELF